MAEWHADVEVSQPSLDDDQIDVLTDELPGYAVLAHSTDRGRLSMRFTVDAATLRQATETALRAARHASGVAFAPRSPELVQIRVHPPAEPVVTTTMFTPAEQAAWEVAVERGLAITAADLRAMLTAAETGTTALPDPYGDNGEDLTPPLSGHVEPPTTLLRFDLHGRCVTDPGSTDSDRYLRPGG
jgi:hypothetical protein